MTVTAYNPQAMPGYWPGPAPLNGYYPAPAPWYPGVGAIPGAQTIMQTVAQVGRQQIRRARFRSQFTPEITIDPNAPGGPASNGSGFTQAIMEAWKPAWYLDTTLGPVELEYWGTPTRNYFPLVVVGSVVLAAVVGGLVLRGLRR